MSRYASPPRYRTSPLPTLTRAAEPGEVAVVFRSADTGTLLGSLYVKPDTTLLEINFDQYVG